MGISRRESKLQQQKCKFPQPVGSYFGCIQRCFASDSSIIVGNSGAMLGTINLTGSGNLELFSPDTNSGLSIDGGGSSANTTLSLNGSDLIILLDQGTHNVTLTDGNANVH